ncbi:MULTISPECIES: polyprenyl synthetase family protein [unclassified Legionella]|uniref:polyprenyl synthetase family protein n=1 Tax=unclassified Legionella TaxID=2622702 RepID=UPI0010545E47|nr:MULTISPECIES: farnesyl diphosphate synthase [unclassified Legionella]MDI9819076.1 polyprenyl synthetase family protein [Legionella sp. PL877]
MINSTISHYQTRHESTLHELLAEADIPAEQIRNAINYALFPGGKRLRPVLVYLGGEIINVELPVLDIIAAAIELIHCYSLVHDDLPAMDNDDLRRGKPSCHKAFSEATAILAGDGMQALAIDLLLRYLPQYLPLDQVIAITHDLVKASGPAGMVSGQSLDLSELSNANINESELRTIHSLKTGQLISTCFDMVLTAGHCSPVITQALKSYATHLGLVFQMQDDYLDYYAKTDSLGKGRASDAANNKRTFASLYDKESLFHLITTHFQQAKDVLLPLAAQAKNLVALTDYLQQRSHL